MRHITNKEWKRIVEQTSRTDLPEPPFSRRYRERRLELERMVTMKEDRKFTFQPGLIAATAAALAIAAVPAGMIWKMSRNQMTPPETPDIVETSISPAAAVEVPVTEPLTEPIDNSIKTFEFGWLPEGMYLHEDGPYAGKIHSDPEYDDLRGITPDFIRMPEGMDYSTLERQILDPAIEDGHADDYKGVCFDAGETNREYLAYSGGRGWNQVWMPFDGTPYVMHLYYQGITEEEIREVLANLRLVPSDEETAGIWVAPEERGPQKLEFSVHETISIDEANGMDTPWQGKIMQDAEFNGFILQEVATATAQINTDTYPGLRLFYVSDDSDDKIIDMVYTTAPADDLWWDEDTDADFDILELSDFRVRIAAWNCTEKEYNYVCDAVRKAASEMDETLPGIDEIPWFWLGYGVNSHGETYASAGQVHMDRKVYDQLPDLIRFGGDTYKEGFVRKTELFEALGDDPDDAMNHLMQDFNKTDTAVEAASLNVYDKEGEQVLHVIKYYKEP